MDSNKKPVTEAEKRLQTVISELDTTIGDLLDKADFVLMELMEAAAVRADDMPDDKDDKLSRVNRLAEIACDYLTQASITLMCLIERENWAYTKKEDK